MLLSQKGEVKVSKCILYLILGPLQHFMAKIAMNENVKATFGVRVCECIFGRKMCEEREAVRRPCQLKCEMQKIIKKRKEMCPVCLQTFSVFH